MVHIDYKTISIEEIDNQLKEISYQEEFLTSLKEDLNKHKEKLMNLKIKNEEAL